MDSLKFHPNKMPKHLDKILSFSRSTKKSMTSIQILLAATLKSYPE